MEPEGQRDKVKPEESNPEAKAGRGPTKVEPEGQETPAVLVD